MAAFIDAQGATQQVEITLDTIKAAKDRGMSLRQYVNSTFDTDASKYGDAFSQLCASEGIVLVPSKQYGIKSTSLESVLNPVRYEAGTIVRNPSNQGRALLIPAIGALVEDKLVADLNMNADEFDSLVAIDDTIADEWLLWPEISYTNGPEAARSQVISQLARPSTMMSITTAEKSVRIPTFALGIEWSEQATKYVNLDLLSLAIARQAAVERNDRANVNLLNILNGDADMGQASLSSLGKSNTAVSFDSTASTGITQKAWMKFLFNNSRKRRINALVTDIDGAMAIENRTGRPVTTGDNPNSPRIDTVVSVKNPTWATDLQIFVVDPSIGWPSNTILGLDTRYGIQRVTSLNASYQAQEDFVLRRGSAMRFDYGQICRRIFVDAFNVLTYA